MKASIFSAVLACGVLLVLQPAFALDGQVNTHDPSTVAVCDGKYYVYSTGRGLPFLVSDDGFVWRRGGSCFDKIPDDVKKYSPSNNGTGVWAPDVIELNNQYCIYYAVSAWDHFDSAVGMITSPTLDPKSPDYKWSDRGPIAWSDGKENLNAIDPGVFHDPNDGTLWLVYGSYHGPIRLMQLDPKTGLSMQPDQKTLSVSSRSEAADLIFHEGWYYLLVNHGTCCQGATSTYEICVGRSKKVTGPYTDSWGVGMTDGGGNQFLASGDRKIGPWHFGLLDLGGGVQKFSCHYECDLDHGGASVLDIRPLLWRDGWPVAGENLKAGSYQIRNKRTGTNLEVDVPGVPVFVRRGRGPEGGGGFGGNRPGAASRPTTFPTTFPAAVPVAASRPSTMPAGPIDLKLAAYLLQAQQQWTITPVHGVGGTPGSAYVKITLDFNGRAMQADADGRLSSTDSFTGADNQLWRIDQLTDGSYRIMPKAGKLALTAGDKDEVNLSEYHDDGDSQRWSIMPQ